MGFKLIKLKPDDWELFRDIRLRALKTFPAQYGSSYEEEAGRGKEIWQGKLASSQAYALLRDDAVIGMARALFNVSYHVSHVAEVISIFVDPVRGGPEAENFFMQAILSDLRDNHPIAKVKIRVNADQQATRDAYQKLGFAEAGIARREMKVDGAYLDQVQMELFFEDKL